MPCHPLLTSQLQLSKYEITTVASKHVPSKDVLPAAQVKQGDMLQWRADVDRLAAGVRLVRPPVRPRLLLRARRLRQVHRPLGHIGQHDGGDEQTRAEHVLLGSDVPVLARPGHDILVALPEVHEQRAQDLAASSRELLEQGAHVVREAVAEVDVGDEKVSTGAEGIR